MQIYIDKFIISLELKHAAKNTIDSYKNDLKSFDLFLKHSKINNFKTINKTNILAYLLYLEKNKLAKSTTARHLACLKTFYDFLYYKKLIDTNPSKNISSVKSTRRFPESLTIEETNKLMSLPNTNLLLGIRDKAMLEILYATGMKISELLNIEVSDIYLEYKYIMCNYKKRERTVPLGDEAINSLKKYLKIRDQFIQYEELTDKKLFLNNIGEPLSRQGFNRILRIYGEKAGIAIPLNPNIIRNSFAVHLLENGADLKSIQEMMGHKETSTTAVYLQTQHARIADVYAKSHPRFNTKEE